MNTVAITGVTGLLGANVAVAFMAAGWRVLALTRSSSYPRHLAHLPLDWRVVPFADAGGLAAALGGSALVVHCAGVTSQSSRLTAQHRLGNIDLTRRVLDACAAAGVRRLIHCSSTVTCGFSTPPEPPVTEDRAECLLPPWPDGYAASKRQAEDAVLNRADDILHRSSALDALIVNPGFMLGPLDTAKSSGRLILEAARGRAMGWTEGCNNFVDARDVAAGILAAAERGRPGERYILGGENLTYRDMLTRIAKIAGREPPHFKVPQALALAAGTVGDILERVSGRATNMNLVTARYASWNGVRYSSAKAARELGYRARPIERAIEDTVAWFEQQGLLARRA